MNKSDLRRSAIKHLNTKKVQYIKKILGKPFTDKKERREFDIEFDKGFIKSFISTRQKHMEK